MRRLGDRFRDVSSFVVMDAEDLVQHTGFRLTSAW